MTNMEPNKGEIVMYQPDETIRLEVRMDEETVWLTQQQMAELFDKDRTVISRHIRNIYKEEELEESITCAKFAHMGSEGDQTYARSIFSSVRRYHPWRASSTTARSLMPTPTSSASSSRPNTLSCSSTTTLMRIHL